MKLLIRAATASCLLGLTSIAEARSLYDGSWDLRFVTQRGTCDPTYEFQVNVNNGTHHASESGPVQRLRLALWRRARLRNRSGQIRFWLRQAF